MEVRINRKEFTLIELLAVIVILAIIATPIILNIIEDARTSVQKRSIELYADAIEPVVVRHNLTNNERMYG